MAGSGWCLKWCTCSSNMQDIAFRQTTTSCDWIFVTNLSCLTHSPVYCSRFIARTYSCIGPRFRRSFCQSQPTTSTEVEIRGPLIPNKGESPNWVWRWSILATSGDGGPLRGNRSAIFTQMISKTHDWAVLKYINVAKFLQGPCKNPGGPERLLVCCMALVKAAPGYLSAPWSTVPALHLICDKPSHRGC